MLYMCRAPASRSPWLTMVVPCWVPAQGPTNCGDAGRADMCGSACCTQFVALHARICKDWLANGNCPHAQHTFCDTLWLCWCYQHRRQMDAVRRLAEPTTDSPFEQLFRLVRAG